jgi:hypothetical protein
MNLLTRIALSDGDPKRTIEALRLINEQLAREVSQRSGCCRPGSLATDLLANLEQPEARAGDGNSTWLVLQL